MKLYLRTIIASGGKRKLPVTVQLLNKDQHALSNLSFSFLQNNDAQGFSSNNIYQNDFNDFSAVFKSEYLDQDLCRLTELEESIHQRNLIPYEIMRVKKEKASDNQHQPSRCFVTRRSFSFLFLFPCFFQGLPCIVSDSELTGPLPGL